MLKWLKINIVELEMVFLIHYIQIIELVRCNILFQNIIRKELISNSLSITNNHTVIHLNLIVINITLLVINLNNMFIINHNNMLIIKHNTMLIIKHNTMIIIKHTINNNWDMAINNLYPNHPSFPNNINHIFLNNSHLIMKDLRHTILKKFLIEWNLFILIYLIKLIIQFLHLHHNKNLFPIINQIIYHTKFLNILFLKIMAIKILHQILKEVKEELMEMIK